MQFYSLTKFIFFLLVITAIEQCKAVNDVDSQLVSGDESKLHRIERELEDERKVRLAMADSIAKLERTVQRLEAKVNGTEDSMPENKAGEVNAAYDEYQYTSFGCLNTVLTLSCANDGRINVTNAKYGKYNLACAEGCCPPHPRDDCYELVYDNQPSDWVDLKYACDNKTSCSYEYLGSVINECEEGYIADYMHIYFTCSPQSTGEAIGFTASSLTKQYSQHELIIFNDIINNIGGFYNNDTCSFLCPVDGLYFFSVGFNTYSGNNVYLRLFINNNYEAVMFADAVDGLYGHSSALTVTSCYAGQTVGVICSSGDGCYVFDDNVKSLFAGALLHSYA